jgi:hypothetical protein
LPPRDGWDLARVLLDRADDDITLVRRVVDDADSRFGASCSRRLTESPTRSPQRDRPALNRRDRVRLMTFQVF